MLGYVNLQTTGPSGAPHQCLVSITFYLTIINNTISIGNLHRIFDQCQRLVSAVSVCWSLLYWPPVLWELLTSVSLCRVFDQINNAWSICLQRMVSISFVAIYDLHLVRSWQFQKVITVSFWFVDHRILADDFCLVCCHLWSPTFVLSWLFRKWLSSHVGSSIIKRWSPPYQWSFMVSRSHVFLKISGNYCRLVWTLQSSKLSKLLKLSRQSCIFWLHLLSSLSWSW